MSKIIIFGKKRCSFCQRAKELCETKGVEYSYIDIEEKGITRADLEDKAGVPVSTVPQIFNGEDYIGGFDQLNVFLNK
jgi:glutaredoxin 1